MAEVCHKPDDIWKLEHKRSNVWLHFLVNESKKDNLSQAKCVYCGQISTIPNAGTTTSLRFHLLAKNQHGGKTIDMNVNPFSEAKSTSETKPTLKQLSVFELFTHAKDSKEFVLARMAAIDRIPISCLANSKLRTRLKPETFDTLCFLRAHLQNK